MIECAIFELVTFLLLQKMQTTIFKKLTLKNKHLYFFEIFFDSAIINRKTNSLTQNCLQSLPLI